jgi:hypothetical protein
MERLIQIGALTSAVVELAAVIQWEIREGTYRLAGDRQMRLEPCSDGWRLFFYPALGVPGAWTEEGWTYEREALGEYLSIALLAGSSNSPSQPPTIDANGMVVQFP